MATPFKSKTQSAKWHITPQRSLSIEVEQRLNEQIKVEGESSHIYLAMASWCEKEGYENSAKFLYQHSDEERMHMLKLMKYLNEAGGHALAPELVNVPYHYDSLQDVFENVLKHEIEVTKSINELANFCFVNHDFASFHFLQWYVMEQREEESLARRVIDVFKIIGLEGQGLWMIDQEIGNIMKMVAAAADNTQA